MTLSKYFGMEAKYLVNNAKTLLHRAKKLENNAKTLLGGVNYLDNITKTLLDGVKYLVNNAKTLLDGAKYLGNNENRQGMPCLYGIKKKSLSCFFKPDRDNHKL